MDDTPTAEKLEEKSGVYAEFTLGERLWGGGPGAGGTCYGASSSSHSGQDARAPIADILARGGPDAEALEQQILTRLVALNHERAAEEKRGLIRWLRPDYQNSASAAPQPVQATLQGTDQITGILATLKALGHIT